MKTFFTLRTAEGLIIYSVEYQAANSEKSSNWV
jgi:hypothetical protein